MTKFKTVIHHYNGWSNWETWYIHLHLFIDAYREFSEDLPENKKEALERIETRLFTRVEHYLYEKDDDTINTMDHSRINYTEIAEHILEEHLYYQEQL